MLIVGLIILANWYLMENNMLGGGAPWPLLIGGLFVLHGIMKIAKPGGCGHPDSMDAPRTSRKK